MPKGRKPVAGQLGVITKNIAALRAQPDSDSEQVTQALIGQSVVAEGGQGEWLFVQTWDTYRGWVQAQDVRVLEDQSRPYASTGPVAVVRELYADIFEEPQEITSVMTKATVSAELEVAQPANEWAELNLPDGRKGFIRRREARLVDKDSAQTIWLPEPNKLVETAAKFVGVPYVWGGTTPFGLDCSGLVQLIYRIHNVTLLRDARLQAGDDRGRLVKRSDLRPGDMVFFGEGKDPDTTDVTHVGMVVGNSKFIHSSASLGVTITSLDDPDFAGIYWGARRLRLATLDPGGGAPED